MSCCSPPLLLALLLLLPPLALLLLRHLRPLLLNYRLAPPGSFGWPLLGETLGFLRPHSSNSIGTFLEGHCSRYGKVFKSHLFFSPAVVSCDQELNQFILQNEDRLFQCSYPKPVHGILGSNSLLVVVGEKHRKLRTVALSLVNSTKSKADYLNDIETIALHVMEQWRDKQRLLFCQQARKFTFSVIVKQVLGLEPGEPQTLEILDEFLAFMKGLISFPLYIPGLPYARAVQARRRISGTVKSIVEARRRRGEAGGRTKGDFLDVLLSAEALSEDEKVSFVLDSLLGGYETTSLLIIMAVYFLGRCPSALRQLEGEHRSIRARKDEGEMLNWEDYKRMEFTQCVVNESLRCGNIVKFVHRKALKDVRFKDYHIPSGWKVLPVFSAVHLDNSLHANASEFNPWRWEGQNQATCKKFTPFGGGPRFCPGSELAKVEAAFFLHHLVLSFRWTPEGEDKPMAYPYVEFQKGLPLKIEPIDLATAAT